MSKKYKIEYYQVNIDVGDCEIILLVDDSTPAKVEKAVLIDGGKTKEQISKIRTAIKNIEGRYGSLKLDAMVITHWDEDHYTGLLRMLIDDLEERKAADPNGTDSLKVSFLNYDSDGIPASTLYVPYLEKGLRASLKGVGVTRGVVNTKTKGWELGFGDAIGEQSGGGKRMKRVCKVIPDVDFSDEKDNKKKTALRKAFNSRKDIQLTALPFDSTDQLVSQVIARELFSGNKLDMAKLTDKTAGGPEALLKVYREAFGDAAAAKPGLFCVAVNNRYLPPKSGPPDDTNWRPTKGKSTPTNISSISCVIIWPNASVSHYFAGDARSDMEAGVIQWTGLRAADETTGGSLPPPPPIASTVPVVKASHHGAPTSSPLNLCQVFKPSVILFPAGKNTYLHPDWSNLFYVYAYIESWRGNHSWCRDTGEYLLPIHPTTYPYYLGKTDSFFASDSDPFELVGTDCSYAKTLMGFFSDKDKDKDLVTQFRTEAEKWKADTEEVKEKKAHDWAQEKLDVTILRVRCDEELKGSEVDYTRIDSTDSEWEAKVYYKGVSNPKFTSTSGIIDDPSASTSSPTKKAKTGSGTGSTSKGSSRKRPIIHRTVRAAASGSDVYFYIMSSLVEDSDTTHAAYVVDEWDKFVSALSLGFIAIAGTLSSTTADVDLHDCDEWRAWFIAALSPSSDNTAVNITVSASLVNSKVEIDHFSLVVPLALSSDSTFSLSFGPSSEVGQDADSSTFDPIKHFLRFPMSADSTKMTLADLVSFSNNSPDAMQLADASDLTFQLDENKSAVWFSPVDGNYSAAYRLQSKSQTSDGQTDNWSKFTDALKNIRLGLWDDDPSSVILVVKRQMGKVTSRAGTYCVKTPALGLSLQFSEKFTAVAFFSSESYIFALKWKDGALQSAKDLLKKIVDDSDDSQSGDSVVKTFEDALAEIQNTLDILQVTIEIQKTDSGFKIAMVSLDAQVTTNFGNAGDGKAVVFLLSFVWPRLLFRGTLYVPDSTDQAWQKSMPDYEELLEVTPIDVSNLRSSISILDLIPGVTVESDSVPEGIPTEVTQATLQIDRSTISFSGVLEPSKPSDGDVPPVSFDRLELAAYYDWDSQEVSFCVSAVVSLHPSTSSDPLNFGDPQFLSAYVGYDSDQQTWTLAGQLSNINFGTLLTFFEKEEQSQVQDILGEITINSASLTYEYSKGKPSNFQFDGSIAIAELELDFLYIRDTDGWEVKAALSDSYPCTLSDVVAAICGQQAQAFQLPDFIGGIQLDIPQEAHGVDWEDSLVYLHCVKPSANASMMIFSIQLVLGKMRFIFLQLSYPPAADATVAKPPKRVLIFSFADIIPSLDIPVIGTIQNPIDGLQFLWVHDGNTTAGLTRAEVQEINDATFKTTTGLLFKESKATPTDADIVLVAGCHFMLLVNDSGTIKAVLDYKFDTDKKQSKSGTGALTKKALAAASSQDQDSNPGGVSKAAVHKSVGPLSLSNIGLQYKDGKLFIVLDATLALGPISMSLLGFGIGVELSADIFTDFKISDIGVELHGLAAGLDKPPLLLAGLFEDMSTPTMELFAGGVAVSVKAYSFLAFGSYGVIHDQSQDYKTFFFFAQLRGPLIELEFASINGVTLGFGYNSHLKYPTVDEILDFPLVKGISTASADAAGSSSNVLTILSDAIFKIWVHPQEASLWFAAGLEVLAFEALDVRAVAVIEIDPYVSFGLFADAVCSLPPAAPRDLCYVYVELGITCRVDIKNGTFSVEGKLSPNSFVLHPSCHLVGGFALYYWFDPSPYAGDFVFSIGGYHPSYHIPTYYPRPQRLTISWQLDSHIGITGQTFFAVTPKVCMGGGTLSVLYSVGPLSAHLDAHAEFLMVWSPFHFIGDIGVSIGVAFQTKIWFVNTQITADVSGTLHLEGPPFGGNVHVNFYLFGFDIFFGDHPGPPPALTLDEFWDLLSRSSNQQDSGKDIGVTLVVQSGYAAQKNRDVTPAPQAPWVVVANQFRFLVQCRFALGSVQFKDPADSGDADYSEVLSGTVPVYSKAMHCTEEIMSALSLSVTKSGTSDVVGGFIFQAMEKNVPSAQWGQYVSGDDPCNDPRPASLLDGSNATINAMLMGVVVAAPLPEYPDDHIPPYSAHDAMYVDIIKGELFPSGDPSSEAGSWLPTGTTWDGAKKAWTGSQGIVDAWSGAFGWTDRLVGDAPAYLLAHFEAIYLDIPSLTTEA